MCTRPHRVLLAYIFGTEPAGELDRPSLGYRAKVMQSCKFRRVQMTNEAYPSGDPILKAP